MDSNPKAVRVMSETAAAKVDKSLVLRSRILGADHDRAAPSPRINTHDVSLAGRFTIPPRRTGKVSKGVAADFDHRKSEEGLKTLLQFENGKNQGENKSTADSNSDPSVEERPEAGYISNQYCLLPTAEGFTRRKDTKLQVLYSLVTTCVDIGMNISLDPTMLVLDPSPPDVEYSLSNVQRFFAHHDTEAVQTKFLLVILPDATIAEQVEEFCEDIGVVYQCLPLYRITKMKGLKAVANEIKAKVMEWNILSDSHKDLNGDEMTEYYDSYNYKEMGGDDGYNCKEMESVQRCSSHNESGVYTSEEKNPKGRDIMSSPDREESEHQLLQTIYDAIPQAESANRKPWVCLNFSLVSGKELLRFLSELGNVCMSIGMDLSPEPTMLFQISTSREEDVAACLWTVFKFFKYLKTGKGENLVLVIVPEASRMCNLSANVEHMCKNLELVCQFCLPSHARGVSIKNLVNTADCMKKLLQGNTPESYRGSDPEVPGSGSQRSSEDSDAETTGQTSSFWERQKLQFPVFESHLVA